MKAITTTYHGPTNYRGSRIIADDGDGNRVTIPVDDSLRGDDSHESAARALCAKMGWHGTMISGHLRRGMVWVFEDGSRAAIEV